MIRSARTVLSVLGFTTALTLAAGSASTAFGQEVIQLKGSHRECLGSANGKSFKIVNKTGEPMHDFTLTIEKRGGGDPGVTINKVVTGTKFLVDDNMNGHLGDADELDEDDSSPGTTTRSQIQDSDSPVAPDGEFPLQVVLSGYTNGDWCLTIQPTDKHGGAIGEPLSRSGFQTGNGYFVSLTDEAAATAPFGGIAFNDMNLSGGTLYGIYLRGEGFSVVDAVEKDSNGLDVGSSFDPGSGYLSFGSPVSWGSPFFIRILPDQFFGGQLMTVYGCTMGGNCCAAGGNYGSGWPGANGVPALTTNWSPMICGSLGITLGNSRGAPTYGVLFMGLSDTILSTVFDGDLLVIPSFSVPIPGVPATGLDLYTFLPCDDALCGVTVVCQLIEVDPAASVGVSFTPGLKLTFGH